MRIKKGQNQNRNNKIISIVVLPALPVTSLGYNLSQPENGVNQKCYHCLIYNELLYGKIPFIRALILAIYFLSGISPVYPYRVLPSNGGAKPISIINLYLPHKLGSVGHFSY